MIGAEFGRLYHTPLRPHVQTFMSKPSTPACAANRNTGADFCFVPFPRAFWRQVVSPAHRKRSLLMLDHPNRMVRRRQRDSFAGTKWSSTGSSRSSLRDLLRRTPSEFIPIRFSSFCAKLRKRVCSVTLDLTSAGWVTNAELPAILCGARSIRMISRLAGRMKRG